MCLEIALLSFLPARLNNLSALLFSRTDSLPLSPIFLEAPKKKGSVFPEGLAVLKRTLNTSSFSCSAMALLTHFQLVIIYCCRSISAEGTNSKPAVPHLLLLIIPAQVGDPALVLSAPHLIFQPFGSSKSSRSFGNSIPTPVLALATSTCSPDLNSLFSPPGDY